MATFEKLSVSLPKDLVDYLDGYRDAHEVASRSEVVARAVRALRNEELIASYKQAAQESIDTLLEADVAWGLDPSTDLDW